MRVILDTCVLSELRRDSCSPRVRSKIQALAAEDLFLSVVTIGEIAKGIALLDPGSKKAALDSWLNELHREYSDRILPIDSDVANMWGIVTASAQKGGVTLAIADGLIAATGIQHGMAVMTRNVKDFEASGVRLVNPWEDA